MKYIATLLYLTHLVHGFSFPKVPSLPKPWKASSSDQVSKASGDSELTETNENETSSENNKTRSNWKLPSLPSFDSESNDTSSENNKTSSNWKLPSLPSFDSDSNETSSENNKTSSEWKLPSLSDSNETSSENNKTWKLPSIEWNLPSYNDSDSDSSESPTTLEILKEKWLTEHPSAVEVDDSEMIRSDNATCSSPWSQCGGKFWSGSTCCSNSRHETWSCRVLNSYYSQCEPECPEDKPCMFQGLKTRTKKCRRPVQTSNGESPHCRRREKCVHPDRCIDHKKSLKCTCSSQRPCMVRTRSKGDYCAPFNFFGKCDSFATECTGGPYAQCGGFGFSGHETCPRKYSCVYKNDYYSQCLPI